MSTYESEPDQLRAAIEAVLAQAEQDWTLFIHDDASERNIREIVEPYLNDPRITFERSEKRLGIGGNWNACLARLNTTYVQLMFQDDVWDPGYLKAASAPMDSDSRVGFVSVEHTYAYEKGLDPEFQAYFDPLVSVKQRELSPGHHDGRELLHYWIRRGLHPNIIGEPSFVMMRKACFDAAGKFLEDMPQFLDVEYWTRLLRVCDWFNVTDSYGSFRVHMSAASVRNQKEGKGLFDRLRCLEQMMSAAEGVDREIAKRAIAEQFAVMIRKFRNRAAAGKAVKLQGSGAVKSFALKHPLLMMRGLWMYLSKP